MIWAGLYALGPAWGQSEPGLEIRLFWAFLSIPVGFALLAYHMTVLMAVEFKRGARP
jgi:TRAP-type C4-dicarboxylate transport system permease small subunit